MNQANRSALRRALAFICDYSRSCKEHAFAFALSCSCISLGKCEPIKPLSDPAAAGAFDAFRPPRASHYRALGGPNGIACLFVFLVRNRLARLRFGLSRRAARQASRNYSCSPGSPKITWRDRLSVSVRICGVPNRRSPRASPLVHCCTPSRRI